MEKKFGALSSSTDPSQLSATISGLILTFSGVILAVAAHFNVPLTNTNIGAFATQIGIAGGALWTLFGLLRKGTVAVAGAVMGR